MVWQLQDFSNKLRYKTAVLDHLIIRLVGLKKQGFSNKQNHPCTNSRAAFSIFFVAFRNHTNAHIRILVDWFTAQSSTAKLSLQDKSLGVGVEAQKTFRGKNDETGSTWRFESSCDSIGFVKKDKVTLYSLNITSYTIHNEVLLCIYKGLNIASWNWCHMSAIIPLTNSFRVPNRYCWVRAPWFTVGVNFE